MGELIKRLRFFRFIIFGVLYKLSKNNIPEIKEKFKGLKDIIIVCNGPSLNRVDLDNLRYPCIGMNKIDMIFEKTSWRPDLIVVNNGLVIKQNKEFFNSTGIPVVADIKGKILGLKTRYFFLPDFRRRFSVDFDKYVGSAGTVTYTALQLAFYIGVERVHIIGMDHNYNTFNSEKSTSSIQKFDGEDVNHFDPNYFKGKLWGTPNLFISELGYRLADDEFRKRGMKIVDRTIQGKCNIFEKGRIEDLYN